MGKLEQEYYEIYGDVPCNKLGRLDYFFKTIKSLKSFKGKIFQRIREVESIKWKKISYIIYLVPKASPRPRYSSTNNVFYVKGAADNKRIMNQFMKQKDFAIIKTPCEFTVKSYLPIPKSMTNMEQLLAELEYIRPISVPDWDNLAKTYSDMIKGNILYDDALIISGCSEKYYSVKPRIEVTIRYMESYDCKHNERKYNKK